MANFPFVVGDSLQIGTATISATGNAIVLPTGTSVGGTQVATTQEVATGGGPKITNLQITDNSWTVLDDTAVDTAGGYVLITGTNFVSGALVYFNQTPATSVAFVSTTSLRVTVPALTAGTYIVYVINPDGGTAIRVPGLTASANPAWQTASALPEQYDGLAISLSLVATDATSYTLVSGSLPPGLSLNSNTGVITGTVTGVAVDTTYTFTVRATDAQLQDSPRTFTVTITVSDAYFKSTTLLLSGSAISANTVIRDSSTNNFNLTVYGDSRASNFTPYGTGWSVYFDGSGDYLELTTNTAFDLPGDYTIEFWMYLVELTTNANYYVATRGTYQSGSQDWYIALDQANKGISFVFGPSSSIVLYAGVIPVNTWTHVAFSRSGSTARSFLNGVLRSSITDTTNLTNTRSLRIGADSGATINNLFSGYLSNWRIIKGTALYTANFTPATTNLTSVANTSLLTCNANRFLDSSTNNFTITRNGDARVVSFNPFNITNTGVNGSAYFDGTGDYLSAGSNSAFSFGTGSYTVECWVYPSSISQQIYVVNDTTNGSVFYFETTGSAGFTIAPRAGSAIVSGGYSTLIRNSWNHVVFVRGSTAANQTSIFVNGTRVANGTDSTNWTITGPCLIGGLTVGSYMMTGYLSNTRIVKGSAVYDPTQTTLTVPTQPLTAITNTQLLTLQYDQPHNNHTFLDSSSNQFVVNRAGNASQGTFSPFSQTGWSVFFDGDGSGSSNTDSISVPDTANLELGSDNFTIECWVFQTAASSVATRILNKSSAILINSDSTGIAVDSLSNINTSPYTVTFNAWTHVAVTRSSNTLTIYINGIARGSGAFTGSIADNANAWYIGNDPTSVRAFPGYISNFRMVKGVVVYTTNFTPPTSMLTAITGTTLLVCQSNRLIDNSTNNLTVTRTGDIRVTAFSPFGPTAVYNPVVHGGSAYFDGSGDYLSIPNNSAFDFGSGDFSIEAWVYVPNVSGSKAIITKDDAARSWIFDLNNADAFFAIPGSTTSTLTNAVQANTWVHLYFGRSGNTMYKAVNGSVSSDAWTTTIPTTSTAVEIGRQGGYGNPFNGYISGLRVLKGSAAYTSNFTPSAPPTAISNTVLLTNFADAAILDSTGRTVIETVADAKTSSVVTKFTGGSMYFDGTGDYATIPASELFTLRTADFTVECWIYFVNFNNQQFVGTLSTNSTTSWAFYVQGSNLIFSNWNVTAVSYSTASMTTSTWYHVATTRQSGTFRLFVNGTVVNSNTPAAQDYSSTQTLYIGDDVAHTGTGAFTGYIADLRITRGYARYTANFTAPTAPARLK